MKFKLLRSRKFKQMDKHMKPRLPGMLKCTQILASFSSHFFFLKDNWGL